MAKKTVKTSKKKAPVKKKKNKKKKENGNFLNKFLFLVIALLGLYIGYDYFVKNKDVNSSISKQTKTIPKKIRKKTVAKKQKKERKKQKRIVKIKDEIKSNDNRLENFHLEVSRKANKYLGMSFKSGGDPEKGKGTDNSHLICSILKKSAEKIGLGFDKYMTMKDIIANSYEVGISDLQNGDLIVLKDGMIGLIYGMENPDSYYLIYASGSQKKVVTVESSSKSFRYYWLKPENKKGYYRLKDEVFTKK